MYVDDVRLPFQRMIMCHMWADTLEELFAMADKIGVARYWLQGHQTLSQPRFRKASWVHFDIALSKKKLAIEAGAILTDKYGPVLHCARPQLICNNPALVEYAETKINSVTEIRLATAITFNDFGVLRYGIRTKDVTSNVQETLL